MDSSLKIGKTHELKCWPESYQLILEGKKRFEVRNNDRDFHQGDILHLREFDPLKQSVDIGTPPVYTGRHLYAFVDYCMTEFMYNYPAILNQIDGLAIMSITIEEIGK